MAEVQQWTPIADLPSDWERFARPDLDTLRDLWSRERGALRDPAKVERFEEQLAMRWAIETGILERLYVLDRGVTETLIDLGLGAVQRLSRTGRLHHNVAQLIQDQREALDFVFSFIKGDRLLTQSYIKELHQLLLQHQDETDAVDQFGNVVRVPLIRGAWKQWPNNPLTPEGVIHQYCPPEFVQDEMDQLIAWHHEHQQHQVRPEIEAAWLHHRFTQIHPFQDGNGRVARALATLVFLRASFLPLVVRDEEHRERYLDTLAQADAGDLAPLVNLFANIQTDDLNAAIKDVRELRDVGVTAIARAAAGAARRRTQEGETALKSSTQRLVNLTSSRLEEIRYELQQAFASEEEYLDARIHLSNEETNGYWTYQIGVAARTYQYHFDGSRWRCWVELRLQTGGSDGPVWRVLVSFHHKRSSTNVMAAVVLLTTSDRNSPPTLLGSDQEFTYSTSTVDLETSFRGWLEPALQRTLADWPTQL